MKIWKLRERLARGLAPWLFESESDEELGGVDLSPLFDGRSPVEFQFRGPWKVTETLYEPTDRDAA